MRLGSPQDERLVFGHLTVHTQHLRVQSAPPFIDQSFARDLEILQLRGDGCNVLIVQFKTGRLINEFVGSELAHLVDL